MMNPSKEILYIVERIDPYIVAEHLAGDSEYEVKPIDQTGKSVLYIEKRRGRFILARLEVHFYVLGIEIKKINVAALGDGWSKIVRSVEECAKVLDEYFITGRD